MKTKEIGFKVENGKRTETFYQERKQETLEEAAERLWLEPTSQLTSKNSFIQGAKWQQEQDKNKYSEESECVNMYLDDLKIQRKSEDGQEYSIVGRIKQLEKRYLKEMSEVENYYLQNLKTNKI